MGGSREKVGLVSRILLRFFHSLFYCFLSWYNLCLRDTKNGVPVHWIKENYQCPNCFKDTDNHCCKNQKEGNFCKADSELLEDDADVRNFASYVPASKIFKGFFHIWNRSIGGVNTIVLSAVWMKWLCHAKSACTLTSMSQMTEYPTGALEWGSSIKTTSTKVKFPFYKNNFLNEIAKLLLCVSTGYTMMWSNMPKVGKSGDNLWDREKADPQCPPNKLSVRVAPFWHH